MQNKDNILFTIADQLAEKIRIAKPRFIVQCANCHEEWDEPRALTDMCECGFKLDSINYLDEIQFTIHR